MESIYSRLGEKNLQALVDSFYDLIEISDIKDLFIESDMELVRKKQFLFLSQFLGGPQLYSNEYGHPKMRARHFPHKVTNEAKDIWLHCMKQAINTLDVSEEFKILLYNHFPHVAQHMVNS